MERRVMNHVILSGHLNEGPEETMNILKIANKSVKI